MSEVFDAYAQYYDLLYCDKDYTAEVDYVVSRLRRHTPALRRILELGCGTGVHAEHLARQGFAVHGVDLSQTMIERAEARKSSLPSDIAQRLTFDTGDARSIRLSDRYDAVLSLFHVMSYQTANSDLSAVLNTAAAHLGPGGVFLFDFWYGPAVLSKRPEVRVKRFENNDIFVTRIAEPVLRVNENLVEVNFEIRIDNKRGGTQRIAETHRMRYWFIPELVLSLESAGFKQWAAEAWLCSHPPDIENWSASMTVIRDKASWSNDCLPSS